MRVEEKGKREKKNLVPRLLPGNRLFARLCLASSVGRPSYKQTARPRILEQAAFESFPTINDPQPLNVPPYRASLPSSSSIRRSWLYLQIRSVRLAEPVLICPVFNATARSAIVVSSVSPDR